MIKKDNHYEKIYDLRKSIQNMLFDFMNIKKNHLRRKCEDKNPLSILWFVFCEKFKESIKHSWYVTETCNWPRFANVKFLFQSHHEFNLLN
jgi:hypothetical protein